ncbi:MAG TPA: Wzt carbohydrate-binding domain-containing protein, partial [Candidatus Margulisiibacteriota bacterium]|nr:Wzt carbohydrate-binding domain-containing protein [Candidatus Margulisiibacteriota bacterium]
AEGNVTTDVDMRAPFAIEVDCRLHGPVRQPLFSLAIVNSAGVTCVWNISTEGGLSCEEARGDVRLRAWYDDNRLMKGYYRVDFAVQDVTSFEVVEQLAGITSFAVAGSSRARGVVAMTPRWELSTLP